MRRLQHVVGMGEKRNAYRVVVGKPERRRRFENPRCRWKDNLKCVFKK
jgi:hypothetical protein